LRLDRTTTKKNKRPTPPRKKEKEKNKTTNGTKKGGIPKKKRPESPLSRGGQKRGFQERPGGPFCWPEPRGGEEAVWKRRNSFSFLTETEGVSQQEKRKKDKALGKVMMSGLVGKKTKLER